MHSQLNIVTGQIEHLILTKKILLQYFDIKPTTLPSEDDGDTSDPFVGNDGNEHDEYNDKATVGSVSVENSSFYENSHIVLGQGEACLCKAKGGLFFHIMMI